MSQKIQFPPDFQWGTATAAYQIEGAVHEDGRGESIWDAFAHTPGKVVNGDTGDIACDHYHRWKEDIKIIKELGCKFYRFSIAWPRIIPDGRGKVNQAGIDFYNRLIDELLNNGIHPLVTLYHWDLPTALPNTWLERGVVDAFSEFTTVATRAFGDRVIDWVTINEPWCASFLSYKLGIHAPGLQDTCKAIQAAHHQLLAHGKAVSVLRSECPQAHVGIALNLSPFYPATQSLPDCEATRYGDGELARWFLDPLYGRGYPADILNDLQKSGVLKTIDLEFVSAGDMDIISVPTDFIGINYYSRNVVKASATWPENPVMFEHGEDKSVERTEIGWEIYPKGLFEVLERVHRDYAPAEILITENGASYGDGPGIDGQVHDQKRIDYLRSHLEQVYRAIQAGIPVKGYYLWSLMDNFEWSLGYSQRFGIVHVDYQTQKRTVKDSAKWYSRVIEKNGFTN
jgi:beta-glucosidase